MTDVRTIGAVGVVQLDRPVDVVKATDAALDSGVWLRPFRDLIYTMPPYVCTDDDLAQICTAIEAAVIACMMWEDWLAEQAAERERAGLRRGLRPARPPTTASSTWPATTTSACPGTPP